jgi:hypothetical protein
MGKLNVSSLEGAELALEKFYPGEILPASTIRIVERVLEVSVPEYETYVMPGFPEFPGINL